MKQDGICVLAFCMLVLNACSPDTTTSGHRWVAVRRSAGATATATLASTAASSTNDTTVVPLEAVQLRINRAPWLLTQPHGIAPITAANAHGVFWVQYPTMTTNANQARFGLPPLPQGPYRLLFTPNQASGGMLNDHADMIAALPSANAAGNVMLTGAGPAGPTHFWLRTYTLPDGAQNGGLVQVFWIDSHQHTMRELVHVDGTGGGRFLSMAIDRQWLFWQLAILEGAGPETIASGGLIDLTSGQSRTIDLGGVIDQDSARWNAEHVLHYTQAGLSFSYDPATRQQHAEP